MSQREPMTGHYAGCATREVKSYTWNGKGTIVTLECGHKHFTGKRLHRPTRRECLDSPCYHPLKEWHA